MVFVHARNQTNKTANFLKETASKRNLLHLFEPDKSIKTKKAIWNVKNKSLESLLPFGLGVHHAGKFCYCNISKILKKRITL